MKFIEYLAFFLLIALFTISVLTFAVKSGNDNNIAVIKNTSLNTYINNFTSTITPFQGIAQNQSDSLNGNDPSIFNFGQIVYKAISTIPLVMIGAVTGSFNVVFMLVQSLTGFSDSAITLIFSAVMGMIVILGALLIWRLVRVGE
jgi:hypothetical protein